MIYLKVPKSFLHLLHFWNQNFWRELFVMKGTLTNVWLLKYQLFVFVLREQGKQADKISKLIKNWSVPFFPVAWFEDKMILNFCYYNYFFSFIFFSCFFLLNHIFILKCVVNFYYYHHLHENFIHIYILTLNVWTRNMQGIFLLL